MNLERTPRWWRPPRWARRVYLTIRRHKKSQASPAPHRPAVQTHAPSRPPRRKQSSAIAANPTQGRAWRKTANADIWRHLPPRYAWEVVRFIKPLARLLIVLTVAGGVPYASALAGVVGAPPAPAAIGRDAISAGRLPAEAAVSREAARGNIAAAWRALQIHPGIVPDGVVAPALAVSRPIALASGASFALLSFPSSSLRGPPSAI